RTISVSISTHLCLLAPHILAALITTDQLMRDLFALTNNVPPMQSQHNNLLIAAHVATAVEP
ncbi:hypothetical protein ACJX0J_019039, partial [Zea mays]